MSDAEKIADHLTEVLRAVCPIDTKEQAMAALLDAGLREAVECLDHFKRDAFYHAERIQAADALSTLLGEKT